MRPLCPSRARHASEGQRNVQTRLLSAFPVQHASSSVPCGRPCSAELPRVLALLHVQCAWAWAVHPHLQDVCILHYACTRMHARCTPSPPRPRTLQVHLVDTETRELVYALIVSAEAQGPLISRWVVSAGRPAHSIACKTSWHGRPAPPAPSSCPCVPRSLGPSHHAKALRHTPQARAFFAAACK